MTATKAAAETCPVCVEAAGYLRTGFVGAASCKSVTVANLRAEKADREVDFAALTALSNQALSALTEQRDNALESSSGHNHRAATVEAEARMLRAENARLVAQVETQRIDLLASSAAGQVQDAELRRRREHIDTLYNNARLFQEEFNMRVAENARLLTEIEQARALVADVAVFVLNTGSLQNHGHRHPLSACAECQVVNRLAHVRGGGAE